MTVLLKPLGRGNWTPMRLEYAGQQLVPLFVRVGAVMEFGGLKWRVCQVLDGGKS